MPRNIDLSLRYIYINIVFIIECFIVPYYILHIIVGFDTKKVISFIYLTSIVAATISFILFVVPDVNFYVKSTLIHDPLSASGIRSFSIAEGSTFSYSITNAIIVIISLLYNQKRFFYISSILLIISIAINARIGFIILFFGISSIIVLQYKHNSGKIFRVAILIALCLFLVKNMSASNETLKWAASFFTESVDFFHNYNENTTYNTLINDMFFYPETVSGCLFGEGIDIWNNAGMRSDIGYINQIFFGGLLYLFLLSCLNIYMFRRLWKASGFVISFILFGVIFISNFKGPVLNVSTGFVKLIYLYYILLIVNNERNSI
ncbi:O-antigen ligase like membrane protein [Candidatus Electronema aureum]